MIVDQEVEAQGGQATCAESPSSWVAEPECEPVPQEARPRNRFARSLLSVEGGGAQKDQARLYPLGVPS